ncbi:MAG: MauE/DoxX family redox-associated membrane protein, partial [Pseudomonas sp.]
MHIDPILILASAIIVAVILASAATHKLRAPARFVKQLEDYQLLPQALLKLVARSLPLVEIGVAFALLVPASRPTAALLAAALLALYAAA